MKSSSPRRTHQNKKYQVNPTDSVIQCSQTEFCLSYQASQIGYRALSCGCGFFHVWTFAQAVEGCGSFSVFHDCSSVSTTRLDSTQQGKPSEYHPQERFDKISTENAAGAQPSLCNSQGSTMRHNSGVPWCSVLQEHREGSKEANTRADKVLSPHSGHRGLW